jgi:hypothetical protein
MPRTTEMEIRIGESFDPDANQWMRVLRSREKLGAFTLVEAKPEALSEARTKGESFDWIDTTETDGLSADQIGKIIAGKLSAT